MFLTKPFSKLNIKGSFHYDRGFYYFRNIENRILFGGGRNLDFKKEKTMKTLVKVAAIAACFVGLHASKASAEFPRGDRNDVWVLDTGGGYTEVEWTYLVLLDMGLTEYEAMVLLGDEAIAIPNLMSADEPYVDSIAIPNLLTGETNAVAIPAF